MSQNKRARDVDIEHDIEDLRAITGSLRRRALMRGADTRLLVMFYDMAAMELVRLHEAADASQSQSTPE